MLDTWISVAVLDHSGCFWPTAYNYEDILEHIIYNIKYNSLCTGDRAEKQY